MRLAQNNDVVHTLTPDRSDQPFGTGHSARARLVRDAHGAQPARDDNAVNSIPISDHMARGRVPRKSLGYLTCPKNSTRLPRRIVTGALFSLIKPCYGSTFATSDIETLLDNMPSALFDKLKGRDR